MNFQLHTDLSTTTQRIVQNLGVMLRNDNEEIIINNIKAEMINKQLSGLFITDKEDSRHIRFGFIQDAHNRVITSDSMPAGKDIISKKENIYTYTDNNIKNYLGTVTVFMTRQFTKKTINTALLSEFLQILFVNIALTITLLLLLNKKFVTPVRKLIGASLAMSSGDLEHAISIKSNDEIGILAYTFSFMRDSIRSKISSLKHEITNRIQAEEGLKESEKKYRTLFASIADPIFIIDYESTRFVDYNQTAIDFYGYSAEELVTMTPLQLHVATDRDTVKDKIKDLHHLKNHYMHVKKDGTLVHVEVHSTVINYNGNKSFLCIIRDITGRIKIEEELRRHRDHLEELVQERTERLKETQNQLVEKAHKAGMADIATGTLHNVGNLLNSVRTSLYVITETLKESSIDGLKKANNLLNENIESLDTFILENPKGKKLMIYYLKVGDQLDKEFDTINQHTQRLISYVNAIVDVIGAQQHYAGVSSFLEQCSLEEVVEDALKIMQGTILTYNISIVKDFDPAPKVKVHKTKLIHIIINLIKNAKEAMLQLPMNNRHIIIAIKPDNNKAVLLTVKDNGSGINKDNLDKIFEYGFTTKSTGHGFGLHSCSNYMKEMDGSIWIESEGESKGVTVFLKFPLEQMKSMV